MRFIFVCLFVFTFSVEAYSQAASCNVAEPFCSGITYAFPMNVNTSAESGPNYGCLLSQPNPIWHYLEVVQSGDITIRLNSPTMNDIDFACWGPYNSPTNPCSSGLSAGAQTPTDCPLNGNPAPAGSYPSANMIDCSFDIYYMEDVHISNAIAGQYYLLMISNFSNTPGNIEYFQSNVHESGAGLTSCSGYTSCNISNITYQTSSCDPVDNLFDVSGLIYLTDPPDSGILKITENGIIISSIPCPISQNPVPFSLSSLVSDGQSHHYFVSFSEDAYCFRNLDVVAPMPCVDWFCNAGSDQFKCALNTYLDAVLLSGYTNAYWTGPAGIVIDNLSSPNSLVTASVSGVYSLVWHTTSPSGIIATDTVQLILNTTPNSNFTLSTPVCFGDTSSVQYIGNASATANFDWDLNDAQLIPGTGFDNFKVKWSNAGSHFIKLRVDENGCASSPTTRNITVPERIIVTPFDSTMNCATGSTQVLGFDVINNVGSYTYQFSSPTPPPLIPGNYNVTVTDFAGCKGDTSFTVLSSSTFIYGTVYNTSCVGINDGAIAMQITSNNLPVSYLWSNGQTSDSISNLTANGYIVTVTDASGCSFVENFNVAQPPALTLFLTNYLPACAGVCDGKIMALPSGGTLPYTYYWNDGADSIANINLCSGAYTVTLTDANGCTRVKSATLQNHYTVSTNPIVNSDCDNSCNGSINPNIWVPFPPSSQIWSNGATSLQESNLCAGQYNLTITDTHGCASVSSYIVNSTTNTLAPTYTLITDSSCGIYCSGSVLINTNGGVPNYIVNWGSTVLTYMQNSFSTDYLCPGNYNVTITDGNNCSSNVNFSINSRPQPIAQLTCPSNMTVCQYDSITLSAVGTGETNAWSSGIIDNTPFYISQYGQQSYVFSTTSNSGCIDTVKVSVNVLRNLCEAGSNRTTCFGSSVLLTASSIDIGVLYEWSGGVQQSIPFYPTVSSMYYVTVTNSLGCSNTDSVYVTVNPLPIADAGEDVTICYGELYQFNATGGLSYNWSNGAGQGISQALYASQTYIVTVYGSQCVDRDTLNVTVLPDFGSTNISDTIICAGQPLVLNATGGESYLWSQGVLQGIPFIPSNSSTFYVTITNSNNCIAIDSVHVNLNNGPILNAGNDIVLCSPDTVVLHATVYDGTFVWLQGNIQDIPIFVDQTTDFIVSGTNMYNCTSYDTVTVILPDLPVPEISFQNDTLFSNVENNNKWLDMNGIIPNESEQYFVPLATGEYFAITESCGCSSDTSNHIIVVISSLSERENNTVFVYPVPADNMLIVEQQKNFNNAAIISATGKWIDSIELNTGKTIISLTTYSPGLYMLILNNEKEVQILKFNIVR